VGKGYYVSARCCALGHNFGVDEMTQHEIKLRRFLVGYFKECLRVSPERSMAKLATASGMAPSTLNRFLREPMYESLPRTDTLLKLYVHTEVRIFAGFDQGVWRHTYEELDQEPITTLKPTNHRQPASLKRKKR